MTEAGETQAVERYRRGELALSGRSALAAELRDLPPQLRKTLGLPDVVIVIVDVALAVTRTLMDDQDTRPWHEKLDELKELLPELLQDEEFEKVATVLNELASNGEAVAARLKSGAYQRFLRRLLGAARFDRIASAAKSDAAVFAAAARRVLRHLLPLAAALDNCVALLTPSQIARVEGLSEMSHSLLQIAVHVDSAIDQVLNIGIPLHTVPVRETETRALDENLEDLAERLHVVLEGQSREALQSLSEKLSRKVQGARDVLDSSADGVSQAANSLVEFVDRLLRQAFHEEFVIDWVSREWPTPTDLVYEDSSSGQCRPTKRGQALCFVHAGRSIDQPSPFHELAATSLAGTRQSLQRLKHADSGMPAEVDELRGIMSAIEGFIVFAIRVGWSAADDDEVEALRSRLAG